MSEEKSRVPQHVAVIMDGNGRWAKARGWPRLKGHQEGATSLRAILRACRDHGVKYLTVYAFSSENWIRPKAEVSGLMTLLRTFLRKQEFELHENKVRLRMIGQMEDLPAAVQKELQRVMAATAHYPDHHLILALSYGSRAEITAACRQIAREARAGRLDPEQITERTLAQHLYLPDVPDPDLLIRTSGEMRISNFLLWQISYAELYVTPVLWPDFREPEFAAALADYAGRHRRFGDIK